MAEQRDIDRWNKGKDHWNSWAQNSLREKEKLKKAGKWAFEEGEPANEETKNWIATASVDFSKYEFGGETDFNELVFPCTTIFMRAIFKENANFSAATFSGDARFNGAAFQQDAVFERASFSRDVNFSGTHFSRSALFFMTKFSGRAEFNGAIFSGNARFIIAKFLGNVGFGRATFLEDAEFYEATFSGGAEFHSTAFQKNVRFDEAKFSRGVGFDSATFSGNVRFNNATFVGDAVFISATFAGDAWFYEATFSGNAQFDQCIFDASTVFDSAEFKGDASFNASKNDGPFSLADASFKLVPDFIQTGFRAPVRLDDINISQAKRFLITGDKERAARYRALKKIAIEAHDHVREQQFFASEVRERRGSDDPKRSARYIFGFLYEIFSDFGQSFIRPLGGLLVLFIGFTFVYVLAHYLGVWPKCGPDGLVPMLKAAYLSFVNSLPFIGVGKAEQIKQVSNCLYGADVLPLGITILTTFQTLFSTVFIFLFLLAVRNHFKIK